MSDDRLRVVIAEDHYLFREGTRQLLESSGKIEIVAAVGDADALLDQVKALRPDTAVVDIRMPPNHQTEGIDAARRIRREYPATGVVVLSQYVNAVYAFELFQDGTEGLAYLLKDRVGDVDELRRAVVTVARGGSVIDPAVVERLLARDGANQSDRIADLTDREHSVLGEMAQGKSNSAIAETLFISESSVEKHINAILVSSDSMPAIARSTVGSPQCSPSSATTNPRQRDENGRLAPHRGARPGPCCCHDPDARTGVERPTP